MIKKFNFLISCPRLHERDACAEIWYFFSFIGDEEAKCRKSKFPGLVYAKSSLDPFIAIKKLRALAVEDPYSFRFVLKIQPIEEIVPSTIDDMIAWVKKKSGSISNSQTFRITVEKRMSDLDRDEIIEILANLIDNKVNLKNPDKIVMVQILGDYTGLSIIDPEDIISIPKIIAQK
ncbi:MAG: THUMP domain-containing protein [Promethearchaeota archaeon]